MQFFTWEFLGTMAGASLATGMIVSFLKDFIKIPTQILSYLVAFLILGLATVFIKIDAESLLLCFLNAFIVASATSNTVSVINRISDK